MDGIEESVMNNNLSALSHIVRVSKCVCANACERKRVRKSVCVSVRGSDGFHYSNENNDYSDSKQDSVKKKLPVPRKVSNVVVSFENLATKLGVD